MRRVVLALALGLAALSGGCKSACVSLAEKICLCQATQADRDSCNSTASARSDQVRPSAADETTCAGLVDSCNCHELDTPQGKRNCGLAR